jgi:hypothetical protein
MGSFATRQRCEVEGSSDGISRAAYQLLVARDPGLGEDFDVGARLPQLHDVVSRDIEDTRTLGEGPGVVVAGAAT